MFNIFSKKGRKEAQFINKVKTKVEKEFASIPDKYWEEMKSAYKLKQSGEPQKAIECYNRALALNPKSADAWYEKALILDQLNNKKEALDCIEKAYGLGLSFLSEGQYVEANSLREKLRKSK
jgi:tetratricopeptide (TPR) repeat protein